MELTSRKGAMTGHNEEVSGLIVNVYDDPMYGIPSFGQGSGVYGGRGENLWLAAQQYNPVPHIDSRITSAFSVSGSGGGNETRPRNGALVACIVDG
jgi:hypothetical protein